MDRILSILESLMPGKLPKALSGLTIATAALLYNANPAPLTTQTQLTTMQELVIQQWQSCYALLLGMGALIVSLIYEIHKVKENNFKTQAAARSLHRSLLTITQLVTDEKKRIQARFAIFQTKDINTYTKDTIAEINNLNASGHFIENVSATILRYIDSTEAQSQPVVPANIETRVD